MDDCRATVSKGPLGHEPSEEFKKAILVSEHAPIRDLIIKWKWVAIKHWVTVHWVRHKWECFVATQRSDRTGVPRDKLPQDTPQDFVGEANVQSLIDTMRKRLCKRVSKETRELAMDLKREIKCSASQPEVSDVLVPNCVYRCGCPEINGCHWYEKTIVNNPRLKSTDIQTRYNAYNEMFENREI